MTDQPADQPLMVEYHLYKREKTLRANAEWRLERIKKILKSQDGVTEVADYFTILSNIEDIVDEPWTP